MNSYSVTSRPRRSVGEISAMYRHAPVPDSDVPMPTITRPSVSAISEGGAQEQRAAAAVAVQDVTSGQADEESAEQVGADQQLLLSAGEGEEAAQLQQDSGGDADFVAQHQAAQRGGAGRHQHQTDASWREGGRLEDLSQFVATPRELIRVPAQVEGAPKLPELCAKDLYYQERDGQ
ncbi:hypothetical protein EYF80_007064 [Liparis tanakae]|uniref:Uncharacterized protein n=1 Tax=Liparis tanakae TaxID=230148 RepID=A0A4Z2IXE0_9TELE|nr:hypothetical protein EYF80_007064 [Liparis tanakae]